MKQYYKDALRLGLQSAVAATAFYALHRALGLSEAFVGTISAVLIVQPSIGSTLSAGINRVLATLFGSAIGVACLFLVPHGYGTAAALGLCMFAVNAAAAIKPDWRYGVVAAVAIAMGSDGNAVETALNRSLSIGLGVLIGLLTTFVIWPERTRARAHKHLRAALCAIAERLDVIVSGVVDGKTENGSAGRNQYHSAMSDARGAIGGLRGEEKSSFEEARSGVESLYTAILLLNRAGNEDDIVGSARRRHEQDLKEVRETLKKTIDHLADTSETASNSLGRLRDLVGDMTAEHDVDTDGDAEAQIVRFALRQIIDDLERIDGTELFAPETG